MSKTTSAREVRGVRVKGRTIPAPASISPEAQAKLEAAVGPDGTPHDALHTMPDKNDPDAWRRVKQAADAHYAAGAYGAWA